MNDKLIINTDGASRNNPGPAAIGVVIRDERGKTLIRISQSIGIATNNQAEYHAIIAALENAREFQAGNVLLQADSELVVKQMNGSYRIKNADLKPLYARAIALSRCFSTFSIKYIPREENVAADKLANRAFRE